MNRGQQPTIHANHTHTKKKNACCSRSPVQWQHARSKTEEASYVIEDNVLSPSGIVRALSLLVQYAEFRHSCLTCRPFASHRAVCPCGKYASYTRHATTSLVCRTFNVLLAHSARRTLSDLR